MLPGPKGSTEALEVRALDRTKRGGFSAVLGAAFFVTVSLTLAGCVEPTAGTTASTAGPPPPAPRPSANLDVGSIAGRVVDAELQPVVGADAGIVETAAQTKTDAEGRFTFNEVVPGSYRLILRRLGYEDVARKVDVRAGEVTQVDLTMKAVDVAAEPYYLSVPKNGLVHLDQYSVSYYLYAYHVNQSNLNSIRCDPCRFVLYLDPSPKAVLTEARWPPSGIPVVNPTIDTFYDKDWTPDTRGTFVCGYWLRTNPASALWSDACVKNARGEDKLKLTLLAADGGFSFEHKIETWTTFGYNAELPDDFSAFPKP